MMSSERWRRIEAIYHAAQSRPFRERSAYLAAACAGDDDLRREVESLLAQTGAMSEQILREQAGVAGSASMPATGDPSAALIGARLGHFHIVDRLGVGGMGEVYRARDTKLGRDVAIKILPPAFTSDPGRLARFEREARVLASFNHPHIGAIYGLEDTGGVRALVLELIDGQTLAERIRHGPLPLNETLTIAGQLVTALDAAHERGIVHRDFKPANIKITPEGVVKVLDFGIAKASSEAASREASRTPTVTVGGTREGLIIGTAAYMSPEQARGQPVDKRTDIWAFGCVLYEMLTGRPAFAGETITDIIAAVLGGTADWKRVPAATPRHIRELLARCLQVDPRRRLRDIGDARTNLDEALAPTADATITASAWTDAGHRALWLPILLLGMLAGGLAVWNFRPAAPSPAPAMARFTIPLPAGEQLASGGPPLAISPNGAYLAFETSRRGGRALYLRALSGTDARLVTETSDGYPFFSPDSEWLGFFADGKMKKMPVRGGASINIADASAPRGASWGDDGAIVFAPQSRVALSQVSADGGTPHVLTVLDSSRGETSHRMPMLLPGGRRLIYRAEGSTYAEGALVAYSLETREQQVLVPDGGFQPHYSPTGHLLYLQGTNLMAVPLDVERLVLTGPPTLIVEDIQTFGISDTGSMVYGGPVTQRQEMVWVDRRGTVEPLPATPQGYGHPRLSRDDSRILMSIQLNPHRHIWLYEIARDAFTKLTFEYSNQWPLWTPDSSRVIYASNRPASNWDIFWKAADSTGTPEPLVTTPLTHIPRALSPDGEWLAFTETNPSTGDDLWLRSMSQQGALRPLAQTRAAESEPTFSADSRWIAYTSNESGRSEVYVKAVSAIPGQGQIVSVGGGREPLWASSGGELFYREGEKMWAVDVVTGPAFSAGKPRLLFEGPFSLSPTGSQNYDVSHDGKRFLMLRPQPSAPEPLHIVTNWFEELKRLVPTK